MKAISIVVCIFLSFQVRTEPDIQAIESWELVKDQNSNGWADPGDHIRGYIDIIVYAESPEKVSIENVFDGGYLEMIAGTITSTHGQIKLGNNPKDTQFLVDDIIVDQPWGKAKITFELIILDTSPLMATSIKNHSTYMSSIGSGNTNSISIPIIDNMDYSRDYSLFNSFNLTLLAILIIGILLAAPSMNNRFIQILSSNTQQPQNLHGH